MQLQDIVEIIISLIVGFAGGFSFCLKKTKKNSIKQTAKGTKITQSIGNINND